MGRGADNSADPGSDRCGRYILIYVVILVRRFCMSREEDDGTYMELNRQRELNS